MNWTRKNNRMKFSLAAMILAVVALTSLVNAAGKGLDIEIAYEIKALKITGSTSPIYVQVQGDKLIFSDGSGAVMSAPMGGGTGATMAKVDKPAGVAIAPAGFGSYSGQVFVASGSDEKSPCQIMRIGGASASPFATLPDAGKVNGGKATECRDLEFGTGPFAGKLYAVANGNATIYQIDPSGKATAFATFDGTPGNVPPRPNLPFCSKVPDQASGRPSKLSKPWKCRALIAPARWRRLAPSATPHSIISPSAGASPAA